MSNEQCICKMLEEINGFDGANEFCRFQKYINTLIHSNDLMRIPVKYYYTGLKTSSPQMNESIKTRLSKYPLKNGIIIVPKEEVLKDEWYECSGCLNIWRLVYPDFPFKGLWGKIK